MRPLHGVYAANLAKRLVELVRARGHFADAHTVTAGDRILSAPHIIIATGGRPLLPKIPGAEFGITSDGFFELPSRPRRVAVAGSGYIAVELAAILRGLGSDTLVLRRESVLRSSSRCSGGGAREPARRRVDVSCRPPRAARARRAAR